MKRAGVVLILGVIGVAGGLVTTGYLPLSEWTSRPAAEAREQPFQPPPAPAVSVIKAAPAVFIETVLVTGTLVPREEILVAPEIEGFRVLEVLVEEGDRVTKGQVLARLAHDTLDAQLAQNEAMIAKADAAIAQARSSIIQAEATLKEAKNALERAKPLRQSGHLPESTYDQREAAARTAEAALISARDGLKVAEAEKAHLEAQRRELQWRRANTDVKAPADGIVSRKNVRVGSLATGAGDAMFRIIAHGEVELEAEVPEEQLARMKPGQAAIVHIAGLGEVTGKVRLVSPEIDRATRLGQVRISLQSTEPLRIGGFARGTVVTAKGRGLSVPASAVLYGQEGATVQVVVDNRVSNRNVKTGLRADSRVEITDGLEEGDVVVARAGTFLQDGDEVRPVFEPVGTVSEVH